MNADPAQHEALFDIPPGATVPPKRKPAKPMRPDTARYSRRSKTSRDWCSTCQIDIHELGFAVAPRVAVALWRRVSDTGAVTILCQRHYLLHRAEETS